MPTREADDAYGDLALARLAWNHGRDLAGHCRFSCRAGYGGDCRSARRVSSSASTVRPPPINRSMLRAGKSRCGLAIAQTNRAAEVEPVSRFAMRALSAAPARVLRAQYHVALATYADLGHVGRRSAQSARLGDSDSYHSHAHASRMAGRMDLRSTAGEERRLRFVNATFVDIVDRAAPVEMLQPCVFVPQ